MARKKKHPEHVNHERWLISYADFITLLFAFFVVMFSVSQVDSNKVGKFSEAFAEAVGLHPRGAAGLFDGRGPEPMDTGGKKDTTKKPEPGTGTGAFPAPLVDLESRIARAIHTTKPGARVGPGGSAAGAQPGAPQIAVTLLRRRNELVLRLDLDVLFDSGSDEVRPGALPVLELIGAELKSHAVHVRVEGHTDDVPIHTALFRSNWHLSTARATAVLLYFAETSHIPEDRLSAAGYGEFQPVADNKSAEGRAKNRRVDVVVSASPAADDAVPAAPAPAVEPKKAAP